LRRGPLEKKLKSRKKLAWVGHRVGKSKVYELPNYKGGGEKGEAKGEGDAKRKGTEVGGSPGEGGKILSTKVWGKKKTVLGIVAHRWGGFNMTRQKGCSRKKGGGETKKGGRRTIF